MIPAIRAVLRITVYIKFCISVNGGEVMEGRREERMAAGKSERGSAGLAGLIRAPVQRSQRACRTRGVV